MEDKFFVIAIGGTGMRCLESFVHMCAIGMYDLQEIEILMLDTDYSNGNKSRVEELIAKYNSVKMDDAEGEANAKTFFSAKLNLYNFGTQYDLPGRDSYSTISGLASDLNNDNKDLASLFLDPNVQQFQLKEGYRAQTHLGSMLMYHGIVEAARNYSKDKQKAQKEGDLCRFILKLASAGDNARVFVFGSIFGGTGASSIPVIPTALRDAAKLLGPNTLDLKKVKFGSTLLTQYFSFPPASNTELKNEKVIAKSELFALNCQAALQFYKDDPTVKAYYKRFYHIGWPETMKFDIQYEGKVQTGGATQKNACHIVELLAASAAYDFFYADATSFNNAEAKYLYKSAETDGNSFHFYGNTFLDGQAGDEFANKLGMFLSLAHLILSSEGMEGAWGKPGTRQLEKFIEDPQYHALTDDQCKTLDNYLRGFAYEYKNDEKKLVFGWIYQIFDSVGSGSFLFTNDSFVKDPERLRKLDMGLMFTDEKHWWRKDTFGKTNPNQSKSKDKFALIMRENSSKPNEQTQHLHTLKEKFIAHLFNSLAKAQKFDVK